MTNNIHGVQVGDIYYTSWGYDQTNVDFFEVVAVTAKMATVRPIKSLRNETAWLQGDAQPVKGEYITGSGWIADIIKTRTDNWGDSPRLKNADGHEHTGYPYTKKVHYTQYA